MPSTTITVETITPQKAAEWLTCNVHNRNLDRFRITKLANAMRAGDWMLNGDAIRFNGPNGLLDGQHRLAAVVQSGVAIESVVIRGLPVKTQDTMDRGKSRTLSDILTLHGEKNTTSLASALNWIGRFQKGTAHTRQSGIESPQEALRLLADNPNLREVKRIIPDELKRSKMLPIGLAWALAHIFSMIDYNDADGFFDSLGTGINLHDGSPILHLRSQLLTNATRTTGRKIQPQILAALTIKAWNLWRDGQTISFLTYRAGGTNPESFPIPH